MDPSDCCSPLPRFDIPPPPAPCEFSDPAQIYTPHGANLYDEYFAKMEEPPILNNNHGKHNYDDLQCPVGLWGPPRSNYAYVTEIYSEHNVDDPNDALMSGSLADVRHIDPYFVFALSTVAGFVLFGGCAAVLLVYLVKRFKSAPNKPLTPNNSVKPHVEHWVSTNQDLNLRGQSTYGAHTTTSQSMSFSYDKQDVSLVSQGRNSPLRGSKTFHNPQNIIRGKWLSRQFCAIKEAHTEEEEEEEDDDDNETVPLRCQSPAPAYEEINLRPEGYPRYLSFSGEGHSTGFGSGTHFQCPVPSNCPSLSRSKSSVPSPSVGVDCKQFLSHNMQGARASNYMNPFSINPRFGANGLSNTSFEPSCGSPAMRTSQTCHNTHMQASCSNNPATSCSFTATKNCRHCQCSESHPSPQFRNLIRAPRLNRQFTHCQLSDISEADGDSYSQQITPLLLSSYQVAATTAELNKKNCCDCTLNNYHRGTSASTNHVRMCSHEGFQFSDRRPQSFIAGESVCFSNNTPNQTVTNSCLIPAGDICHWAPRRRSEVLLVSQRSATVNRKKVVDRRKRRSAACYSATSFLYSPVSNGANEPPPGIILPLEHQAAQNRQSSQYEPNILGVGSNPDHSWKKLNAAGRHSSLIFSELNFGSHLTPNFSTQIHPGFQSSYNCSSGGCVAATSNHPIEAFTSSPRRTSGISPRYGNSYISGDTSYNQGQLRTTSDLSASTNTPSSPFDCKKYNLPTITPHLVAFYDGNNDAAVLLQRGRANMTSSVNGQICAESSDSGYGSTQLKT